MLQLCWWEWNELLDHITERDDIWSSVPDSPLLFLRQTAPDEEGLRQDALLLQAVPPPDSTSPWRQFGIQITPLSWSKETYDAYLMRLLAHWTSYDHRLRMTALLMEMGVAQAHLIAIA